MAAINWFAALSWKLGGHSLNATTRLTCLLYDSAFDHRLICFPFRPQSMRVGFCGIHLSCIRWKDIYLCMLCRGLSGKCCLLCHTLSSCLFCSVMKRKVWLSVHLARHNIFKFESECFPQLMTVADLMMEIPCPYWCSRVRFQICMLCTEEFLLVQLITVNEVWSFYCFIFGCNSVSMPNENTALSGHFHMNHRRVINVILTSTLYLYWCYLQDKERLVGTQQWLMKSDVIYTDDLFPSWVGLEYNLVYYFMTALCNFVQN